MVAFRWLSIVLLSAIAHASQTVEFYGHAFDLSSDEKLYTEVHRLTYDSQGVPVQEVVTYISPYGDELGQKTMSYGKTFAPDYSVLFYSRPIQESVSVESQAVSIVRDDEKTITIPDGLFAVDGGFHYLIQEQFSELESGNDVTFNFLSAGRASFIPLRIRVATLNSEELSLNLTLKNFFLSRLVAPIELTYQRDSRQLLEYPGLTNVPGPDGKLYNAKIVYEYPENPAFDTNLAAQICLNC
jgi:hypothetical protein